MFFHVVPCVTVLVPGWGVRKIWVYFSDYAKTCVSGVAFFNSLISIHASHSIFVSFYGFYESVMPLPA